MLAAGVTLDGAPRRASLEDYVDTASAARFLPVQLAGHESMRLAEIVTGINKRSINWLADRVLMTAGAALIGGPPSMEKGIEAMKRWLAQRAAILPDQCTLDTGSGLSYRTELSPRQIVQVLRTATGLRTDAVAAADHADLERAYLGSLSIAG